MKFAMKKFLSLAAILGALAGTASAAPYYMTAPAGGALTPYDIQPVYSIEGIYNFSDNSDVPDTYGARINFSLYNNAISTARHQVTLSAGYEMGTCNLRYDDAEISKEKIELQRIPLTIGYDLNVALTKSIMLDLGAKGGYTFGFIDSKVKSGTLKGEKDSANTGGFAFALTAGLKVQFSDVIYGKIAYEFGRTFFSDHLDKHINYNTHGIVVGLGCQF